MVVCSSGGGTNIGMLPMKSQLARGIFDPKVDPSTISMNVRSRSCCWANLGTRPRTGRSTWKSPTASPDLLARKAFARYGRNLPKRMSPSSNATPSPMNSVSVGTNRPDQPSMFSSATGFVRRLDFSVSRRIPYLSGRTSQCSGTSPSHSTPLFLYAGYFGKLMLPPPGAIWSAPASCPENPWLPPAPDDAPTVFAVARASGEPGTRCPASGPG